ncbi:MAG: hypothetical protein IPO44_00100 [Candidatus Microthrix sp.]|nr:alpha-amylase family glycosyl hydrolase [Candidatus Microthrix sp.]MBK9558033.1 hypothetical protein [Candidatus Microthrix sp.]
MTAGWRSARCSCGVGPIAGHYGTGDDELHLAFNFPAMFGPWDAEAWRRNLDGAEEHFTSKGFQTTWVQSNHDNPRHRTRFGGDEAVARAAAVLLLGLPGTPFLYAGEELGLEDAGGATRGDRRSVRRAT